MDVALRCQQGSGLRFSRGHGPLEPLSRTAIGMDDSIEHYRGEQGRRYHAGKRGMPEEANAWIARLRAVKFLPHVNPGDVVLEYGVGTGWNLASLPCRRRLGHDVATFLAPTLEAQGIEFVPNTASLETETIDIVICHHTLEHVRAPAVVLTEIRRLLRLDGTLWLSVPFEKESRYRRFNPAEPNRHLYSWNVQTLGNLVEECGFTLTEISLGRFGYDRFAAVHACRWRLGEPGYRLIRAMLHLARPGLEVRALARRT
jgi:SAM-dependent methyltransferase